MPQRLYGFIVVLLLIFGNKIFSQEKHVGSPLDLSQQLNFFEKKDSLSFRFIKTNYHLQPQSFFCKKEIQIEKFTSVPLRFRLGSLEYSNYLEQKLNAMKPGF